MSGDRPDEVMQIALVGPRGKNGWLRIKTFRSHANVKWEVLSANQEDFLRCLSVENWDEELMRRLIASHYRWSTLGPRIHLPWQALPHVTHADAAHIQAVLPGIFHRACQRYATGAIPVTEAKPVAVNATNVAKTAPIKSDIVTLAPKAKPVFRYTEAGSD